jgi:hypothetical protein
MKFLQRFLQAKRSRDAIAMLVKRRDDYETALNAHKLTNIESSAT